MEKRTCFLVLATIVLLGSFLISCGEKAPPDIIQAADAMHNMITPKNLSRSMFCAAFPNGKPSQYVSYLFSNMGSAEWPPSESNVTPIEREQMKSIRQELIPNGVAILPKTPDSTQKKQIVMAFDDAKGLVIIKGYVDPSAKPVLVREILLPKVKPAPGVEMIFRSNADLGMSSQSF